MTNNNKLLITPDITIHDMLEAYPHLEDKLIEIVPVFAKLKNPGFRTTIAIVTTLKQASAVGGVSVGRLINRLRLAANMCGTESSAETGTDNTEPGWIDNGNAVILYDAREDLENNVHPADRVLKETSDLNAGAVYLLVTPFTPVPLIDMLIQKGFDVYSEEHDPESIHTYIKKQNPS